MKTLHTNYLYIYIYMYLFIYIYIYIYIDKMTPLQKDPKQLWTIKKKVVYKSGLKYTRY